MNNPQQSESSLNYAVGVSWPRSGHHLLVRLLKRYLRRDFVYCPGYSRLNRLPEKKASCCDDGLCANRAHVTFCKNHDFRFRVPKVPGTRYLVQYRAFLPTAISNFELHVKRGNEDTFEKFMNTSARQARNYKKFMKKWILPEDRQITKLIVRYEDLTGNTEEVFRNVLDFFGHKALFDRDLYLEVVSTMEKKTSEESKGVVVPNFGVKNSRKLEDFRYYSPEWFARLEKMSAVSKWGR